MKYRQLARITSLLGVALFVEAIQASLATASPPELRYAFKADRDYQYEVTLTSEVAGRKVTHKGIYTYCASDITEKQFTLSAKGRLSESVVSGTPGLPLRFATPYSLADSTTMTVRSKYGTTFNHAGTVVSSVSRSHVPLILCTQDALIVEPFSEDPQANWTVEADKRISVRPLHSQFPFADGTTLLAKERVEYKVLEQKGEAVRIQKTYSLKTPPVDGIVGFDMSGAGEFEFDSKQGIIASYSAEYKVLISERNNTSTIPLSLSFRLRPEAEVAEEKQRKEDEERALAMPPTPLEPGELEKLIPELRSGDDARIQVAAQRLAKAIPGDHSVREVGLALLATLPDPSTHRTPAYRKAVLRALAVWTVPEAEQAMIGILHGRSASALGSDALAVLAKFQTPIAAQTAAGMLTNMITRTAAAEALIAMGPVAEDYTIPFVKHSDSWASAEACRVLEAIGSEKSLPILKQNIPGPRDPIARNRVNQTIDAIERRGGKPPVAPEPAGASSDAIMRTWHDATRKFRIEAQFARFEKGQVTLRRQDGRIITLPLERLCKEDQEFVKKQADVVNPFE